MELDLWSETLTPAARQGSAHSWWGSALCLLAALSLVQNVLELWGASAGDLVSSRRSLGQGVQERGREFPSGSEPGIGLRKDSKCTTGFYAELGKTVLRRLPRSAEVRVGTGKECWPRARHCVPTYA